MYQQYRDSDIDVDVYPNGARFQPNYAQNYVVDSEFVKPKSGKKKIFVIAGIVAVIIAAAVVIPLVLLLKPKSHAASGHGGGAPGSSTGAISGGNGSVVTTDNGTTFIYLNNFGGDWSFDPTNPFAPGGRAQSWSPRVGNESWVWGQDIARGVNLGSVIGPPRILIYAHRHSKRLAG
jgi:hypothetical protein